MMLFTQSEAGTPYSELLGPLLMLGIGVGLTILLMVAGSLAVMLFFFSSRRRHTICYRDWSSDVCSSDLRRDQRSPGPEEGGRPGKHLAADRVEYQVDLAGRVLDAIGVQLDEAVGGDRRTWVAT